MLYISIRNTKNRKEQKCIKWNYLEKNGYYHIYLMDGELKL